MLTQYCVDMDDEGFTKVSNSFLNTGWVDCTVFSWLSRKVRKSWPNASTTGDTRSATATTTWTRTGSFSRISWSNCAPCGTTLFPWIHLSNSFKICYCKYKLMHKFLPYLHQILCCAFRFITAEFYRTFDFNCSRIIIQPIQLFQIRFILDSSLSIQTLKWSNSSSKLASEIFDILMDTIRFLSVP